jgi:hypothetical protein
VRADHGSEAGGEEQSIVLVWPRILVGKHCRGVEMEMVCGVEGRGSVVMSQMGSEVGGWAAGM